MLIKPKKKDKENEIDTEVQFLINSSAWLTRAESLLNKDLKDWKIDESRMFADLIKCGAMTNEELYKIVPVQTNKIQSRFIPSKI